MQFSLCCNVFNKVPTYLPTYVALSHLRPCQNIAKKWFVQNNSLRHLRVLQNSCNLTSPARVEKFLSKRIFSFQKVDISLVHGIVSLCRVPIFWFKFMLSPTNSPFFQSDLHAVVCNKFAITDKPLHKHDSNKYQSKAFFICNQRSFQTRFVTCVNKTYWVWVMYWSLLINSTSTAPIRSCVHGWTQFFKIVGFLRQTFPSLPPTHHFSFLLLSQLSRWIRAKRLLCRL